MGEGVLLMRGKVVLRGMLRLSLHKDSPRKHPPPASSLQPACALSHHPHQLPSSLFYHRRSFFPLALSFELLCWALRSRAWRSA